MVIKARIRQTKAVIINSIGVKKNLSKYALYKNAVTKWIRDWQALEADHGGLLKPQFPNYREFRGGSVVVATNLSPVDYDYFSKAAARAGLTAGTLFKRVIETSL